MNKQRTLISGNTHHTPWGYADCMTRWDNGVIFYETPGHGGFWVPKELRSKVAPFNGGKKTAAWFEEDCEALKVYMAFPEIVPEERREEMRRTYTRMFDEHGQYRPRG